jgi:acetyltransferase-like isoleucine patch superfamily enzyme
MNKELAPIILFVYNRPDHTKRTLEALSENELVKDSILHIFADGPKIGATKDDLEKIQEVYTLIDNISFCKETIVYKSQYNKGLADSIIQGVTNIIKKHKKVIVLEDDIETKSGFLSFMNSALWQYEDVEEVMHISGYIYPHEIKNLGNNICFLKILSCWGWATWERAWSNYNHNIIDHINFFNNRKKITQFNINGHADYYNQLINNHKGNLYTWAVRWYASWLSKNGISIFPTYSLVKNIGFDNTGSNCHITDMFESQMTENTIVEKKKPKENIKIRIAIDQFYKKHFFQKKPWTYRLIRIILAKPTIRNSKNFIRKIIRKFIIIILPELKDILNLESRNPLISEIQNSLIGRNTKLYKPYYIENSAINDFTYISKNSWITETTIGKFCSLGPNLLCGWGIHPKSFISTHPMFYSSRKQNGITLSNNNKIIERKPIIIGNDVFIGANVTILDGITIGDGAIIGAGSIVTKSIPSYAIAYGSPIQIMEYRFSDDTITALQRIKWWDFEEEELQEVERLFFDVDKFIEKYKLSK